MGEQQELVSDDELSQLLDLFSRSPYRARDSSSKVSKLTIYSELEVCLDLGRLGASR